MAKIMAFLKMGILYLFRFKIIIIINICKDFQDFLDEQYKDY